jgi:hypothetical protein
VLLLLLHILNMGMRGNWVCELVLCSGWCRLRLRGHLRGRLRVIKGRVRHVGIVVWRRRSLRWIGLRRSEVRAGSANVAYSRVGPRQVMRRLR